jgi:hypothetical protein
LIENGVFLKVHRRLQLILSKKIAKNRIVNKRSDRYLVSRLRVRGVRAVAYEDERWLIVSWAMSLIFQMGTSCALILEMINPNKFD